MIDGTIAQLMLLFDGKDPEDIASAIAAALPAASAEWTFYLLAPKLGISIGMSLGPADLIQKVDDQNEWDEGVYKFVGTREKLIELCQHHEWGDYGDYLGDALDNLLDAAIKAELVEEVTPKVTEEPTP